MKEFLANVSSNILAVRWVKPCYPFGSLATVVLVRFVLWVIFKFITVSTFFSASWYGGAASSNIDSFDEMLESLLLMLSGMFSDRWGMAAILMDIEGRIVRFHEGFVSSSCEIQVVNSFFVGFDGYFEVVSCENSADLFFDEFSLAWCSVRYC